MNFNLSDETNLLSNKIKEIQNYIIKTKEDNNYSNRVKIRLYTNYFFKNNNTSKVPSLEIGFKIFMKTHEGASVELPKVIVNSNDGYNEYTTMSLIHRLNHYKTMVHITSSIQASLNSRNYIVEIIDIPECDKKLIPQGSSLRVYLKQIKNC